MNSGFMSAAGPVAALRVHGVHKRFGRTHVLQGVDLTLTAGERLAVIGPNGAGKSTLFDVISGRSRADAGSVFLHGRDITRRPPHAISRLGLTRSFQTAQLFPTVSVVDHLRCAVLWRLGHRYTPWRPMRALADVTQACDALLDQLALAHRRDTLAAHLSYAEQRMLEIGLCAGVGGDVMLLDEPTAGMSQSESVRVVELIRTLSVGRSLLLIEHDMGVVFRLADRIAVLARGAVIACDTPERVRAHQDVRAAYLGDYADNAPAGPPDATGAAPGDGGDHDA
ncbi:hypothetical protein GCM10027419_35850 [Pandoraea terrae]